MYWNRRRQGTTFWRSDDDAIPQAHGDSRKLCDVACLHCSKLSAGYQRTCTCAATAGPTRPPPQYASGEELAYIKQYIKSIWSRIEPSFVAPTQVEHSFWTQSPRWELCVYRWATCPHSSGNGVVCRSLRRIDFDRPKYICTYRTYLQWHGFYMCELWKIYTYIWRWRFARLNSWVCFYYVYAFGSYVMYRRENVAMQSELMYPF